MFCVVKSWSKQNRAAAWLSLKVVSSGRRRTCKSGLAGVALLRVGDEREHIQLARVSQGKKEIVFVIGLLFRDVGVSLETNK